MSRNKSESNDAQSLWTDAAARERVRAAVRDVARRYGYRRAQLDVLTDPAEIQAGGERFRRRVAGVTVPRGEPKMLRPKLSLSGLTVFRDRLRGDARPVRILSKGPVFALDADGARVREAEVASAMIVGTATASAVAEVLAVVRDLLEDLASRTTRSSSTTRGSPARCSTA